jgi:hypothetical protein
MAEIETVHLKLIPCESEHFEAILEDQKQLEQMLGVVFDDSGWAPKLPYRATRK